MRWHLVLMWDDLMPSAVKSSGFYEAQRKIRGLQFWRLNVRNAIGIHPHRKYKIPVAKNIEPADIFCLLWTIGLMFTGR